jgi:hypothetical protein
MNTTQAKNKTSPARRAAYAGLVAALSLALLYLIYLLPVMKLSILFIVSLLPVALAHEKRYADAIFSFIASALLSGLLFPAKDTWLLYAVFFGWYGIFREFIVTKLNKVLSWVVLAAAFNAAFLPLYFLAGELLLQVKLPSYLILPAAEIAFVAFELLFGLCREYYIRHIRSHIFR